MIGHKMSIHTDIQESFIVACECGMRSRFFNSASLKGIIDHCNNHDEEVRAARVLLTQCAATDFDRACRGEAGWLVVSDAGVEQKTCDVHLSHFCGERTVVTALET